MNSVIKAILIFLLIEIHGIAGISFKKENVTISIIACDTLEVQGIYYFENSDSSLSTMMIYYPFPVDNYCHYPHFISVEEIGKKRSVNFIQKKDGITWNLSMPPHSIDSIKVIYSQKVDGQRGRYILTTTKYWGKPLEMADFKVVVPEIITLSYWSFQSDSVSAKNGKIVYRARKREFYPDNDLLLEWSCK